MAWSTVRELFVDRAIHTPRSAKNALGNSPTLPSPPLLLGLMVGAAPVLGCSSNPQPVQPSHSPLYIPLVPVSCRGFQCLTAGSRNRLPWMQLVIVHALEPACRPRRTRLTASSAQADGSRHCHPIVSFTLASILSSASEKLGKLACLYLCTNHQSNIQYLILLQLT